MSKKKNPDQPHSDGLKGYRILTEQVHSLGLEQPVSFGIKLGQYPCRVFLRPAHPEGGGQRAHGRAVVHLEYECHELDMLRAASLGIRLTEDVLAGLAVVTGMPVGGPSLIQLMDVTLRSSTPFLFSVALRHLHSEEPVTELQISHLRRIVAHWDGLRMGGRLRRAAGLYRRALQEQQTDDLSAFQYGYMGLEALEPALAEQMGVSSGVEETKGKCRACGAEFIRRKTMLAGVRAYIMGNNHPSTAGSHRETEWKGINDLRQNQFHSLRDPEDLYADARAVVPAAAHFLHDAICCLSHAHDLEEPTFWLERGARILLRGDSEPAIDDPLEECRPVAGFREVRWTVDREFGYVPEVRFVHNRPGANIHCRFYWLRRPLQLASEPDLEPARVEAGGEAISSEPQP